VAGKVAIDGNGPDREEMADRLGLTEAQREAAKSLYAEHRTEATVLRETIGESSDREAIRAQMKALRDQHRTNFEEILTGEQKALLEEIHAAREELREERQEEGHRGKSRRRSGRRHGN
jgi:Spy/CpxP family protein refolding chaperone